MRFRFNWFMQDRVNEEEDKIDLLLCWLGIHRYRIINSTFGFGPGGTVTRVQCKICGVQEN